MYCILLLLLALGNRKAAQGQTTDQEQYRPQDGVALVAGLRDGGRSGGRCAAAGCVGALHVAVAGQLLGGFQIAAVVAAVACLRGGPVMIAAGRAGVIGNVFIRPCLCIGVGKYDGRKEMS